MEKITDLPFLFIVGRPRSGTTLLRTLFDAHTQVSVPPECQFIVNLYGKYGKKTNWTKKELAIFFNELQKQWRFDLWKLDNELLMQNLLKLEGHHTYATICKSVYLTYQSVFPKEEIMLLGDKNPGYTIYTRRLLKIFPNARFIHITRDYRDNFVSIKNVDFELPLPALAAQKWVYFFKKIQRDSKKNPSAYMHIRYEDLVNQPEESMKAMCGFAGIAYQPGIFNFHEKKEEVLALYEPGFLEKYHASLLKKINTSRVGLWQKQLTDREVKLLEYTAGTTGIKAGYQLSKTRFSWLTPVQALPGRAIAAALHLATLVVDKLPATIRMNLLSKGPRVLGKLFLRLFNPAKLKEINNLTTKNKTP